MPSPKFQIRLTSLWICYIFIDGLFFSPICLVTSLPIFLIKPSADLWAAIPSLCYPVFGIFFKVCFDQWGSYTVVVCVLWKNFGISLSLERAFLSLCYKAQGPLTKWSYTAESNCIIACKEEDVMSYCVAYWVMLLFSLYTVFYVFCH